MSTNESSAAQMGDEACTRCGATPETGQGEDCPECQGIVEPLRPFTSYESDPQEYL